MIKDYLKQIKNVPINIDISAFILPPLAYFFGGFHSLIILTLVFFFVFLHEHGHIFAANKYGIRCTGITLTLLGGAAYITSNGRTPNQRFWIAIAGPLVNFILAILFFVLSFIFNIYLNKLDIINYAAYINAILFLFNLIPAHPLDGGRILESILSKYKVSNLIKNKIILYTSRTLSICMIAYGIFIFNIILIAIGIFIFLNSNRFE